MPFGEVKLIPGVNVERTPTLLEAGISVSQLIRFKDSLVQKLGGWTQFYPFALPGKPRDLHAWEDLNSAAHLAVGTTTQLAVITAGQIKDITPQTLLSDFAPNITVANASTTIVITDPNISNVTTYDAVYFNTPISVGGLILSGLYPLTLSVSTHVYNITAASASANANTLVTNNTTAAGNATLHFASAVPAWVVAGLSIVDTTASGVIPANTQVLSTTSTTVVMTNNAAGAGVGNGDTIAFVGVPVFTTTNASAIVSVALAAHGRSVGDTVVFPIATTVAGVTVQGAYTVTAVADANNFSITVTTQATSGTSGTMNSGNAEILYYINLGPPAAGSGYGQGGYGAGGYGTGVTNSSQTGTEIAADDWTTDNWGKLLVACPQNGGIYVYDPQGGFLNASLVTTAPPFNGGIFVSNSQQILIAWGSTTAENIGVIQDPMLVKWSNLGDYTNWTVLTTDQAGSFRIPIGSMIKGGMAVANANLIWTDLDLWQMNYMGYPLVYGFNKIGAGAGLVSSHAAQQLRGNVYWMGPSNFYAFTGSGVAVLPCSVWDFVFQNLNTTYQSNVRVLPNTPFNEAGWAFPSSASSNGECDSYVKMNITEPGAPWDYGSLARSAGIDQSVLGNPIEATPTGVIYQHETSNDAAGQPLASSFTTGYFYIAEGQDYAYVDQILPDMKWATFGASGSAQVQFTFNVTNYPGDTPTSYGPYTVTQATEYISVRFRGRQMSVTVASSDMGSFWRLGKVRYRYAAAGRR
jgi:hypothetical protein